MTKGLTHLDADGRPKMVDISEKGVTTRRAVASGRVMCSADTFAQLASGTNKKGDLKKIAELAGIMGAKKTADLIPLCHPLPLDGVKVTIEEDHEQSCFLITAEAKTTGRTGVEMEALTAVTTACLTIYDMAKAVDKAMRIEAIHLVSKSGGVSGDYHYKD